LTPYIRYGAALAVVAILLNGCGTSPTIRIYELGNPAPATAGLWSEAGLPIIELKPVSVPDYLDSSDILRSVGPNEVTASPTGRWGERLSLGLTHALASGLATRLPKTVIDTTSDTEPARRLLVTVEQFEIEADGKCLLSARWRLTAADGAATASGERGIFSEAAGSIDDAAIAAAMSRAVDQLADRIAQTVQHAMPGRPG
jgi:uncharacterized protein